MASQPTLSPKGTPPPNIAGLMIRAYENPITFPLRPAKQKPRISEVLEFGGIG